MFGFQSRKRNDEVTRRQKRTQSRPRLEALETRLAPATFLVNTAVDAVATNLHTGQDTMGQVSLRGAIMAANAVGGNNTIEVPGGTFFLTIAGRGENQDATGDLNINDNLTIQGAGSAATIINGNALDRVFDIVGGKVTISNLTVENGFASGNGGGISNDGGNLTLSSVQVMDNTAVGFNGANGQGGGVFNAGTLSIVNSTIADNEALGGGGGNGLNSPSLQSLGAAPGTDGFSVPGLGGTIGVVGGNGLGGGVFNAAGATLTLSSATLMNNNAYGGGGGMGGTGGNATGGFGGSDIGHHAGNGGFGHGGNGGNGGAGGLAEGGGLFNLGAVTVNVFNTIAGNTAIGGAGGAGGAGGLGTGGAGAAGIGGDTGGAGGNGVGGAGGQGGRAGGANGGGIFNGSGASFTSNDGLTIASNLAAGGSSGAGGDSGAGNGGNGGQDGNGGCISLSHGGAGGAAFSGAGGAAGTAGQAQGGGLFNDTGGRVTFTPLAGAAFTTTTVFVSNVARGGNGGDGGGTDSASGGLGGGGGGAGGAATSGNGGNGGSANNGLGGGLYNAGTASFTGLTVNFMSNQANSGFGGHGGNSFIAVGGNGGNGFIGLPGIGGKATTGNGGNGGFGGFGQGGGIFNNTVSSGVLTIDPRLGAKNGLSQASAIDVITANQANLGGAGTPGRAGLPIAGVSDQGFGFPAQATQGSDGTVDPTTVGVGGGIATWGTAKIDNTSITGNRASTNDNDIDGTFSM